MIKHKLHLIVLILLINISCFNDNFAQTKIMKWQDGKEGCVTLTFDDGSINQFRIAVPLMNERGFPATFFIITGGIPGSKYQAAFVGRYIQEIIKESEAISTNKSNFFERCSVLHYLAQIQSYPEVKDFSDITVGELFEQGKMKEAFQIVDKFFYNLSKSGHKYKVEKISHEGDNGYHLTWDKLEQLAKQGHEIAKHTVSHPFLPIMDKANILYEIEKCSEDIKAHINQNDILSIECPYGIDDERVLNYVYPKFPFVRNGLTDKFIKEILPGAQGEPVSDDKEYVQWQRGPLSNTPISEMKGWIDTSIKDSAWLLLVFHGVEGVGWEALPKERFEEYFDYIKKNENNLWIATFQNAFKYVRERMSAKVESKTGVDSITVILSHDFNKEIYGLPLTLRTPVPVSWKSVKFEQGKIKKNIAVQKEGTTAFVQYRAMPNAIRISIKKNN